MQDLIRFPAGLKQSFVIGIAFEQISVDALKALLRYLRPGGVIEKYGWTIKGRKLAANQICIQCHCLSFNRKNPVLRAPIA
jgi:hypothetical protein